MRFLTSENDIRATIADDNVSRDVSIIPSRRFTQLLVSCTDSARHPLEAKNAVQAVVSNVSREIAALSVLFLNLYQETRRARRT